MPASKPKTWVGRVYLGDGEYHWVGRFTTKRERDQAVAQARVDRPWETTPAPDSMTCDEWAVRWLERMETGALRARNGRRYKDSTIDTHRSGLKAFRQQFGQRSPGSITRIEAEDWAASVPRSAMPSVIQLMNYIAGAEELDRNRFVGLSHRPVGRRHERPPAENEMLVLSEACSALGDYAPVMRAMFTFAAYTLIRPGELAALTWDKIDLNAGAHGRVLVDERFYRGRTALPKSNRERTIAITEPARYALDALRALPGYSPDGLVFRNKTGRQLTAPTMSAYWRQVCARARIDVDFYMATKHFGVWFMKVRLKLPDAVIAAQAGWSEFAVTKMVATYGHAVDERRLDEIDNAFAAIKQDAGIPGPS